VYKEKLRLRSYGTPAGRDKVFFELKKKYKKEVFKRRVSLEVQDLVDYLEAGVMPDVSPQVMREIDYFMYLYHPQPKIYIAYDRIALKGKEDESLRITFDENIRFRSDDLNLCSGDYGQKILKNSQHLTEIKVSGAMPLWLSRALDEQQIYPTSFSKYGYCYQNYILPHSAN
jgi:SPX domain protein involved in polyphosphate accumulation